MKRLTRSEAIFQHRKMWHWIADETRAQKRKITRKEYFEQNNIPDENRPFGSCYVCHYDEQLDGCCDLCLINWGYGMSCVDDDSPYCEWINCDKNDWERAAKLADKIAELPEKTFIGKEEKSPEKITEKENFNGSIKRKIYCFIKKHQA